MEWNGIKDLADGAMVQVMVNIHGGMGKTVKEERSSAEEQFEIMDKVAIMMEHGKLMGNSYLDMLVGMEMEDVKAKLDEIRRMSEGTEDQKALAVMVERRKEERWEEQREREEAEQREAYRKKEMEEAGGDKQELKEKEELAVLMDPRLEKWRTGHDWKGKGT